MGLSLFLIGIVLLIFGFASTESLWGQIAQTFSGQTAATRSLWLLVGGALAVPLGIFLAWRGVRRQ